MYNFLLIIFIIDIILLIPVILMQSGSGAESGIGMDMTLSAFGAKTSEFMLKLTKWLVGIFFVTSFLLGYIKVQETKMFIKKKVPEQQIDQTKSQIPVEETQSVITNQETQSNIINSNILPQIPFNN